MRMNKGIMKRKTVVKLVTNAETYLLAILTFLRSCLALLK